MARTAPAPNMIATPGMNPGNIVAGGGGGAGGGSGGKGKGGKGDGGAGGDDGGDDAEGGGKDGNGGEGCGDPVCPITGKMFLEVMDFAFWAVKSLRFIRHYSSRRSDVSGSFGFGWTHPFGWVLEERRRAVHVYDERGDRQKFRTPVENGEPSPHPFGWQLSRIGATYRLEKPDGDRLTFEKHPARGVYLLTQVADLRGNATRVHYDERGFFCGLTDSEGRPFRATLDDLGRIVRFQVPEDAEHRSWLELGRYRYDERGDLVEFIDAVGFVWEYRYDHHLMIEHKTGCGLSYLYRYDGKNKDAYCVESWGEYIGRDDPALLVPISEVLKNPDPFAPKPKGINYVRLTYQKDMYYSEVENGLGGVTRYFGDSYGRVVKKVEPDGAVIEQMFDPETGDVAAENSSAGVTTRSIQDADGLPVGYVKPDGSGKMVYLPEPGVQIVEDLETGATTSVQYNEYAEPIYYKYPDGTFEAIEYNHRGQIVSEVHRHGGTTRYVWDAMGNLTEIRHPGGDVERAHHDYLGRCHLHESIAGLTTQFRHDGRSEVVHKKLGNGFELSAEYDAQRNLTYLRYGDRIHRFEYGGLGWLVRHTFPDGRMTEQRFDVEGNVVWVRNERGQEYRIERDALGRVIEASDFEGIVEQRAYDAAGNLVGKTTPVGKEALEYDNEGRLVGVELSDQSVSLAYASTGGIAKVDNGSVPVACAYDSFGMLVREDQGNGDVQIEWLAGFVHTVRPPTGPTITIEQTAVSPTSLRVGSTVVRYAFPEPYNKLLYLGDRLVRRDVFDAVGFLQSVTISRYDPHRGVPESELGLPDNPDQILSIDYSVNAYGEPVLEERSDGRAVEYAVDAMGRVISKRVTHGGREVSEERLAYDAGGSPLLPEVARDHLARPVRYANEAFEYDLAGRLVLRRTDAGDVAYEWDGLDNLVKVTTPTHVVVMEYDGRGRRITKRVFVSGALTKARRYTWDNQILLQELDESTGWTRTYLRHESSWSPFGHVDSDGSTERAYFYSSDATGMPDVVLDSTGQVVWSAERTVYGTLAIDERSSIQLDVRFAGQLHDEDVGLVYNRMRWYDPRTGLYVSPDGKRLDAGLPHRDYVLSPVTFVDPMGQMGSKPKPKPTPGAQTPTGPGSSYPKGWGDRPPAPTSQDELKGGYMVQPGHFAVEGTQEIPGSIPCPSDEYDVPSDTKRDFSKDTRSAIDNAGSTYGCHTCGSKNPKGPHEPQDPDSVQKALKGENGSKGTHFVPDHIPPAALHSPRNDDQRMKNNSIPPGGVRLFPQCQVCSNRQKTDANSQKCALIREGGGGAAGVAEAKLEVQKLFDKNLASKLPWE